MSWSLQIIVLVDYWQTIYVDPLLLKHIWWSNELHILLSVYDKQNMRFLGWEKPTEYEQRPLHSQKIAVWAAISSHGVIGPYIIEDDNSKPIDVTSLVYKHLIIWFSIELQLFGDFNNLNLQMQIIQKME